MVDTISDDDFVGLAFGFQNSRNFYLLSWKQKSQTYWRSKPTFLSKATSGIELKRVHSHSGPGPEMRQALWHSGNFTAQTTLIWSDTQKRGWVDHVPYHWKLMHRPSLGIIRLTVHKESSLFLDSGFIFDGSLKGGRIGPYAFSQANLIWSNMDIRCNDTPPKELMLAMRPSRG